MRITNAYTDRVLTAAETDPIVAEQFIRVSGMIDPPARLLRPSLMIRVARNTRRRRRTDDRPLENLTGPLSAGTPLQ
jgi:hypothetical protein